MREICGRTVVTGDWSNPTLCQRTLGHAGRCSPNYFGAAGDSIGRPAPRREPEPKLPLSPLAKQAKRYRELLRTGQIRKDDIVPASYLIQACRIATEWQLREFTRVLEEDRKAKYRRKDDTFKILKDQGN